MTTSIWWHDSMRAAETLSPSEALRWTRIGALAALAMLLGYLESFMPIPIPGVKLGLANIAVLAALAAGDVSGAFFVGVVKVVATSLLFGNPVTFVYSAVGTLLAFCLMAPLSQLKTMRIEMVSVVGALAHETGQLLVAQALLGTPLVWYSAPIMAIAGCVTGLLCGIGAEHLARLLSADDMQVASTDATDSRIVQAAPLEPEPLSWRTISLVLAYLALVACAMHSSSLLFLAWSVSAALLAYLAGGDGVRKLLAALAPMAPIALLTVIAQIANNQHGPLVAIVGPIAITQPALAMSAAMLTRLASITIASVALIRLLDFGQLTSLAHAATTPLRVLGVPTRGPELALSTTLQLIPLLTTTVEQARERGYSIFERKFWTTSLPELAAELYQAARELTAN
ncbi:MAG: Gx transporter family protein [Atopobiaceae bacterium]|nr:Gx transporter family protein [Atopobiaceae bacterium]